MIALYVLTIIGMFLVQATMFKSLPMSVRAFIACRPLVGVIINFILSGFIVVFTGSGALAGISNVIASVLFGFYLVLYRTHRNISMAVVWKGWSVFRVPCLQIQQQTVDGFMGTLL